MGPYHETMRPRFGLLVDWKMKQKSGAPCLCAEHSIGLHQHFALLPQGAKRKSRANPWEDPLKNARDMVQ